MPGLKIKVLDVKVVKLKSARLEFGQTRRPYPAADSVDHTHTNPGGVAFPRGCNQLNDPWVDSSPYAHLHPSTSPVVATQDSAVETHTSRSDPDACLGRPSPHRDSYHTGYSALRTDYLAVCHDRPLGRREGVDTHRPGHARSPYPLLDRRADPTAAGP